MAIAIVSLCRGLCALNRCEAAREIIGFDRPHKGVEDPGNGFPFAGGDDAVGECGSDHLDRRRNLGGTLDRRQGEFDRAFATRRQDAFEVEPLRSHGSSPRAEGPRVAGERQFDRVAGQGLGFAVEQDRRGQGLAVARLCRLAGFPDRPLANGRPRPARRRGFANPV